MANSTSKSTSKKVSKPYDAFPLTAHPSGRWCKKHAGRTYYFGKTADPWQQALAHYQTEWPKIISGEGPPARAGVIDLPAIREQEEREANGPTIREIFNAYLDAKRARVDGGTLTHRSYDDQRRTCRAFTDFLAERYRPTYGPEFDGKDFPVSKLRPADFAAYVGVLARRLSHSARANEVTRVRMPFRWAIENEMIEKPVRFGTEFCIKSVIPKKIAQQMKNTGKELFTSAEVKAILAVADVPMRAAIMLAWNAGLGPADISSLPLSALDLPGGWLTYARGKTGIARAIPLWPETISAIHAAIKARPRPQNPADDGLVFVSPSGLRWVADSFDEQTGELRRRNQLSDSFRETVRRAGITRSMGQGLYTGRRTLESVGGAAGDQTAVNALMGHADDSQADTYRRPLPGQHVRGIPDIRLQRVVEAVRVWLFEPTEAPVVEVVSPPQLTYQPTATEEGGSR